MADPVRLQVRVDDATLERFRALQAATGWKQAKLLRALLLGRPVIASSNRQLWLRLARSSANLTQLERLADRVPSGTPGLAELYLELTHTRVELNRVRHLLVGAS